MSRTQTNSTEVILNFDFLLVIAPFIVLFLKEAVHQRAI